MPVENFNCVFLPFLKKWTCTRQHALPCGVFKNDGVYRVRMLSVVASGVSSSEDSR